LQLAPVVLPAGRGVAFLGSGDTLTPYDVRTAKLERLPITDCTPVLVRTATAELLCVDWRIGSWYLLGLDNGRRTIVPEATRAHSAIYDEHGCTVSWTNRRVHPGTSGRLSPPAWRSRTAEARCQGRVFREWHLGFGQLVRVTAAM